MDPMKTTAMCALVALAAYAAGTYDRGDAERQRQIAPAVALAPTALATMTGPANRSLIGTGQETTSYVCPMHSHIVSDHEGKCPICGMDLVPQRSAGNVDADGHAGHEHAGATAATGDPNALQGAAILIDPGVRNTMAVRTGKVVRGDLRRSIRTVGKIGRIDPTSRQNVSSPTAGVIVDISGKAEGDSVKSGEFLFSVGSDELYQLERDYQAAMTAGRREEALGIVPRLSQQGISAEQVAQLQNGAEPNLAAQVFAPQDGFVFVRRTAAGDPVTPATMIYSLGANTRALEVIAEIYEQQWGWVKEGQEAEMAVRGLPGKIFKGRIIRVEPPVGYTTRTLEVRLRFDTDEPGLNQGMFAEVDIKGDTQPNVVSVPAEAVIQTQAGARVVIVRDDGSFQPVAIVTGEEAGNLIEVRSGLLGDETVVVSGQFLIDSESNRLASLARMSPQAH